MAKRNGSIVHIGQLKPDPKNARRHNPRNIGMLEDALHEVGAARSIVIDEDGTILAGNGVVEAAAQAGIERVQVVDADGQTIIAVRRTGLTAYQKQRLALYDNRVAELADWSPEVLDDLLKADAKALDGLFSDKELAELLRDLGRSTDEDPGPQIDRAAELQAKWSTSLGQLWIIPSKSVPGKAHRLLCGDSTKAEDVARLMAGEKAQLCFTSPPYWVGKDYEAQTSLAEVRAFVRQGAVVMAGVITRDGGRIVINTSTARAQAINPKADVETLFALAWWQDALREQDWLMRHCRLWVKRGQMAAPSVAARSDIVDQHWETIATFLPTFYCPDGLRRGQEKIGMKWAQQGVWDDIPGEANMEMHGAAIPVELPRRYMLLYCREAEVVYEPFTGTATTFVACEQLGRVCRGLELDPAYVGVSLERLSGMGLEPKLAEG